MNKSGSNKTTIILIVVGVLGVFLLTCCGGGVWLISTVMHQAVGVAELPQGVDYQQWRNEFKTNLKTKGPAPQDYEREPPIPNVSEVTYKSGDLNLKAWVYRPPNETGPRPALLFLHGGFAFGMGDLEACQEAMDRGYVVMAPAVRGENGNPGNFELLLGEVDDARAAAQWLASQPDVDPNRIYAFGHSVGGGISAMLSLLNDVPIQHSGSSGGLYSPDVFLGWADITPFVNSPNERKARLLLGNLEHMQRDHYAYLGSADAFHGSVRMANKEGGANSKLKVEMVPGDHFSSFDESLQRYLDLAK